MQTDTIAISGATILAGEEMEQIDDAVVVIAGEHIVAAGPRAYIDRPEAAVGVDASGLLLIPGFIDAHVHIGFADPGDVLRGGVTTVRDLGWPPAVIFPLAERSAARSFDGPEILPAGPIFTAPGGYPQRAAWAPAGTGLSVASPDEAAERVAWLGRAGATVVKIALHPPAGPVLDPATLAAIVRTAHDEGLRVTGHVTGLDQLHNALAAGLDELAHMLMSNESIPDDTLAALVRAGVAVVPTLSVRFGADRATAVDNLSRFRDLGGTIVYGTDLGNEGPGPGIDAREVQAMTAAGMSAREVIASGTAGAARWLGLEDRGVIAENKRADLVAVPDVALDDPRALTRVELVFRQGRRVL